MFLDRIDASESRKDGEDIRHLVGVVGIRSKAELIELAAKYYPEARVSPKLLLAADRILNEAWTETQDETPRYLDRGRRGDGA